MHLNHLTGASAPFIVALSTLAAGMTAYSASAATITGHATDRQFSLDTPAANPTGSTGTSAETIYVGRKGSGAANKRTSVFVFDLSTITDEVSSATLSLYYESRSGTVPTWNVDLYAVGYTNQSDLLAPDDGIWWPDRWAPVGSVQNSYYEGGPQAGQSIASGFAMLADDFVTASTDSGYVSLSSADLVTVLNNRPAGFDWVFFRLNADAAHDTTQRYFQFTSANSTVAERLPQLEVTLVPEPGAVGGLGLACGGLMALCRRGRSI